VVGRDLKPGSRVRFVGYDTDYGRGPLTYGTIVEAVPERNGYMVLPDGYDHPGGFGYSELETTAWGKIIAADDDFG